MYQKLMHLIVLLGLFLALVFAVPVPSHAQSNGSSQALPTRNQAYLRDVVSLSETIGSAHAVRVRCNGVDDQYWRTYMVQILGLEAPLQGTLRRQMVAGFNRGFERENAVQIGCDATANEREARYAVTGQRLAEGLASYYFPKRPNE